MKHDNVSEYVYSRHIIHEFIELHTIVCNLHETSVFTHENTRKQLNLLFLDEDSS